MKWYEIQKQRPPYGELIWVWDNSINQKILIRYHGSNETWLEKKENSVFPIWAFLNDNDQIETCQNDKIPHVSSYNFITMENSRQND